MLNKIGFLSADSKASRMAGSVVLLAALWAGAAAVHAQGNVRIDFDAAGCPLEPVKDLRTRKGQQVVWQAYQNDEEARVPFEIYFDPLRGQPHKAPQGKLQRVIDPDAPSVQYKYTIVGADCAHQPLDPNIFVD